MVLEVGRRVDHSQVLAQREAYKKNLQPYAGRILSGGEAGDYLSILTQKQQRAFLGAALEWASIEEFGRTPGEMVRKIPDVRGLRQDYDPLKFSCLSSLSRAGIRDAEGALMEARRAASALVRATHA